MRRETVTGFNGFIENLKPNFISGFLVFLIALPLCLGISLASGYPAIAGIFTAIIGGVMTPFLSNSELTIKGPAAGLIVIALGCVTEFGFTGGQNLAADLAAYRCALAVGVTAGVLQMVLGLLRSGILGEVFPSAAIHGMLAAIGVIIISKQFPVVLGVAAKGDPLHLLANIPSHVSHLNPEIALIGVLSLVLLFGLPLLKNRFLKKIPGPMLVLLVAVPLGAYFDLEHDHVYSFHQVQYAVGSGFLVNVPNQLWSAVTLPDFSVLNQVAAWKWILMFALIGSLESILSASAIDLIDPLKRKTDLNRDLFAIGVGNTLGALIGGLPMISEIVRSRANIDNGAKTRYANMFHALFLLAFVSLVPLWLHKVPLAALGAMLVYTGFRLASPKEFVHVFKIGTEQFAVFVVTLISVLATDLLMGVAIGVVLELGIHIYHGARPSTLFKSVLSIAEEPSTDVLSIHNPAIFTNWLALRKQIDNSLKRNRNVRLNFEKSTLVDHSVLSKLTEMNKDFEAKGLTFIIEGLEQHKPFSQHPLAARRLSDS